MLWVLVVLAVMISIDSVALVFAPRFVKRLVADLTPAELRLIGVIELAIAISLIAYVVIARTWLP